MREFLVKTGLWFFVFATGAAGLIYQVTWQKYLSRLLGSDTSSTAIILATFLGGLSLGYYLCGRWTTRVRNHFSAYALLEGIIGLWAFGFPICFGVVTSLTQSWSFSPPAAIAWQGLLCSVLLMGIPTVCMGGTLPFLTRGISRTIEESTGVHALIYAVNTGGAFVGTLLAAFYLLPVHGLPWTMVATSSLNLAAAAFFVLLPGLAGRRFLVSRPEEAVPVTTVSVPPSGSVFPRPILYSVAFLSGLYVMTLENVLIRVTSLSFGSSSYSFSIIVAVFVLSIAVGSFVFSRLRAIRKQVLYWNQFLIAVCLLLLFATLDKWPYGAHLIRITFQSNAMGFLGYYLAVFLGLLFLLILPVGLMGATVPIVFHEIKRDLARVGQSSGAIFAWNTAGNLLGSLIGGIVLYHAFDSKGVFLAATGLTVISVVLLGGGMSPRHVLRASPLALALALLAAFPAFYDPSHFVIGTFRMQSPVEFSLAGPGDFFRALTAGHEVKSYDDGPTGTVAVLQDKEVMRPFGRRSMALVINGKSDSSTLGDVHTLKLLTHIPALLAERKKNVMVVGLGTGVTAGELALYPDVERIDVAEISPSVVQALPLFQEFTHGVHKDPRLRVHRGDAFRVLGRSKEKWDIVISEPSNPWVTGVDSLFTKEFYRLVKDHLTENGLLMQWFHTIVASPRMVAMALNTVQQEFKHLHVFVGSADLLILSSRKAISCDALSRATEQLDKNERVRASLSEISVPTLASILIRELWTSSYVADYCSDGGLQSLDHPRLHYMAGKDFFMGSDLPLTFFLNSSTAAFPHEYLINQRCGERTTFPNSKEEFKALLDSMLSSPDRRLLPLTKALFLRAYLTDPNVHPLPQGLMRELKTQLITFIGAMPEGEDDWSSVGLEGAPVRTQAELLLSHVQEFRNWVVPYPLDGLMALLRRGVVEGDDAYEKNWCALQMARLLLMEGVDRESISAILRGTIRGKDGQILLREKDRSLLEWFELKGR